MHDFIHCGDDGGAGLRMCCISTKICIKFCIKKIVDLLCSTPVLYFPYYGTVKKSAKYAKILNVVHTKTEE